MDFRRSVLITLSTAASALLIFSAAPARGGDGLTICSELNFQGLHWPEDVTLPLRDPFAAGLNISGSFEGPDGWTNLTDNFDGQGISMGLLNQNLGQGSLQPMWIEMRDKNLPDMKVLFTAAHLDSVLGMLKKWSSSSSFVHELNLRARGYSELDDPAKIASHLHISVDTLEKINASLLSHDQDSVTWAKKEVLKGKSIRPDWTKELRNMSGSAPYRTIQLEKAKHIHDQTLAMMKSYGFKKWSSYLFLFDIVVQNGGIPDEINSKYFDWAKKNPKASEHARAVQLLTYRLTIVKKQYRSDVKSRKMAILNGAGRVHGISRNFEREYCFSKDRDLALN